jgi:hypothetical protein
MWNPVRRHRRRGQEDQQQFPVSVHSLNKQGMRAMLKVNKQERETQNRPIYKKEPTDIEKKNLSTKIKH